MQKKITFKLAFPIYAGILALLVALALIYVNSVLNEYENEHPKRHLENALTLLRQEAEDGSLWEKEGVPSMSGGEFEASKDPKADFIKLLGEVTEFTSANWINDTECSYGVVSDGITIAEITLRKIGAPVTKLAIIGIQKYELVSYVPVVHTYTLTLPDDVALGTDISITVNGISLTEKDAEKTESGKTVFTFSDIYTKPDVKITDNKGNSSFGRIPEEETGEIEYDSTFYTLTLPDTLKVIVDKNELEGESAEDGRLCYRIRLAAKAKVEISDLFGNTVEYNGTSSVPLTCYTLMTSDGCTVTVDGKEVPDRVMEISANPEYKNFADLVPDLPRLPVYNIVVLKDGAEVKVTDRDGEAVPLESGKTVQDLTGISAPEPEIKVPQNIAEEVNVLRILEDWSLFMSCDLDFNSLSKHLIKDSYQYNIAYKYNYSIDRTFTSIHTLKDPAFSDEEVTNFVWLTDDCFSVDIRFVKHMIVAGKGLDDEMNERCYFAKDSSGKWKLVGMKEVIDNAE